MILKQNFIKVLKQKLFFVYFLVGFIIIAIPSYYFLNYELVLGNLGNTFLYTEIVLTIIIAILFGYFLSSVFYKLKFFSAKKTGVGIIGGAIGVIVSGCPACSITIASYLGLAGIISILPYNGLELKILSVFILIFAIFSQLKNLETCTIKLKK